MMYVLLPLGLLFFTALVLAVLRGLKPKFPYHWLVATLGALMALVGAFLVHGGIPHTLILSTWWIEGLLSASLALQLDELSWSFNIGLLGFLLALLLTGVVRIAEERWHDWFLSLLLVGVGMVAVMSANLVTLLLSWAILGLVELLVGLLFLESKGQHGRAVAVFALQTVALVVLLWGGVVTGTMGNVMVFRMIPERLARFLMLAVGLHLGVLPPLVVRYAGPGAQRGLVTGLWLVRLATGVIVLVRIASFLDSVAWIGWLLPLLAIVVLVGSVGWLLAGDELSGLPFWVLAAGGLAMVAAMKGSPPATLAFGLGGFLGGGLLSLASVRERMIWPILGLGVLGLASLPLTPMWAGRLVYVPVNLWSILLAGGETLMLAGFIRHGLRVRAFDLGTEQWMKVIYALGLILLLGGYFALGFVGLPSGGFRPDWLIGVIMFGSAALINLALQRKPVGERLIVGDRGWGQVIGFDWLYRLIWVVYRWLSGLLLFINSLLEGEAGLLWAAVILVMFLSLIARSQ